MSNQMDITLPLCSELYSEASRSRKAEGRGTVCLKARKVQKPREDWRWQNAFALHTIRLDGEVLCKVLWNSCTAAAVARFKKDSRRLQFRKNFTAGPTHHGVVWLSYMADLCALECSF